jgi:drug/metabolite transporter (DMT)-like permease
MQVRKVLLLSSLLTFAGLAVLFKALEYLPLSYALVVDRQSSIFNAIFAYLFLGEPWLLSEIIASFISVIGVLFVAQPEAIFGDESNADDDESSNLAIGFSLALSGAIFAAANYTSIRALGTTVKLPWANVIFVQSVVVMLLSLPSIYISGSSFEILSATEGGYVVAGTVIGALGQIAITIGKLFLFVFLYMA